MIALSSVSHTLRTTTDFVFLSDKSSWIFVLFSFMRSVSTNINMMMGIGKWKNIENNSLMLVNLPDTEINAPGKQMFSIFHVPIPIQLLLFSFQISHKDWPFGIRHNRPLLEMLT